jgi:hypothetical protein
MGMWLGYVLGCLLCYRKVGETLLIRKKLDRWKNLEKLHGGRLIDLEQLLLLELLPNSKDFELHLKFHFKFESIRGDHLGILCPLCKFTRS